jgi:septal ring factor EnvC (AmiA/AmiB activator)
MLKKIFLLLLVFISTASVLFAQPASKDREELEREKRAIQDELKEIQGVYNKIKGQTKQSLSQLNMLNRKINLQEQYINSVNRELKMIDDDLYLSNLEIYRLQRQLDTLKSEYARTVVYAYKNRSSFDYVNFIFSAGSFNDAIRRVAYLKSYRAYREKQVENIKETQELIAKRQQQQVGRKQQKSVALQSQNKEREALTEQKKEKDQVVSGLKSQEKGLQKQIATRKKRDKDIQNAIAAIIRREIEAARREEKRLADIRKAEDEAKKKAAAANPVVKATTPNVPANNPATTVTKVAEPVVAKKTVNYLELNAKDEALGADFATNRGKFPWPVDNGFVSVPFGPYTIEGTNPPLRGDNPGITIGTKNGSAVKAVFDGTVTAIHNYGEGAAVVIKHGKYFTSYSNLSGVNVSKGAVVKKGQVIGKAGEAEDGSGGQVDFMLMIEAKNVNPAPWLRR